MRNNLRTKVLLYYLLSLLIFSGCHKDIDSLDGSWQTELVIPFIQTEITLRNLTASNSSIQANNDSLLIFYYQEDSAFSLPADSVFSPPQFPAISQQFSLGIIDIPEFFFDFDISLNDMLPYFNEDIADTLLATDSTMYSFPPLQTNNVLNDIGIPSVDYTFFGLTTGSFEVAITNTLPVELKNVHFYVRDITYNIVIKEIFIGRFAPGEVRTDYIPLAGSKFGNQFGIKLLNLSSEGSNGEEVMIDLRQGLVIDMTLIDATSYAGMTRVDEQLIGTSTSWIEMPAPGNERFFHTLFEQGAMTYLVNSMENVNLKVTVSLPTTLQNGEMAMDTIVSLKDEMVQQERSMAGMLFDFTTNIQKPFNRFPIVTSVILLQSDSLLLIDSADAMLVTLNFNELKPAFAAGYFGKKTIRSKPETIGLDLNFARNLQGNILFTDLSMLLSYSNGFGIPIKVLPELEVFNDQTSDSKKLDADSVVINYPTIPGESVNGEFLFDRYNSNMDELFDEESDRMVFSLGGKTNWNGQNFNFAWDTASFIGNILLKVPMITQSDFLLFTDTVKINVPKDFVSKKSGVLHLKASNGFPFPLHCRLQLLDSLNRNISETIDFGPIIPAPVDQSGKVTQPIVSYVSAQVSSDFYNNLKKSKFGLLFIKSDTFDDVSVPVSLYKNYQTIITISFDSID